MANNTHDTTSGEPGQGKPVDGKGKDFRNADFSGVDFRILGGADFTGANLDGANFQGANLEGVDFRGSTLNGAQFDEGTGATVAANKTLKDQIRVATAKIESMQKELAKLKRNFEEQRMICDEEEKQWAKERDQLIEAVFHGAGLKEQLAEAASPGAGLREQLADGSLNKAAGAELKRLQQEKAKLQEEIAKLRLANSGAA